jgi:uncharacterized protein YecT (DUF1311 family)
MSDTRFRAHFLALVWVIVGAFVGAFVGPGPGLAQDGAVFSPAATEACLASAAPGLAAEACAGLSANRCMADTPQGDTTYGMILCFSAEADWWDARLNASFAARMKDARAMDADVMPMGRPVPSAAMALRDMQRAWIAFRDARCAYEAALWMGGSGAGPAVGACLMRETARQTLIIEGTLGE